MTKDLVKLGAWAILLHALGLFAFVCVSERLPHPLLKSLCIVMTGAAAVAVLYVFIRKRSGVVAIVAASFVMAVGYQLAFHAIGLLGLRGLLRDVGSGEYMMSLLAVTGTVFAGYLVVTAVLALINKMMKIRSAT
jgi:4-hydroxybenzoate polyprenyltransferase